MIRALNFLFGIDSRKILLIAVFFVIAPISSFSIFGPVKFVYIGFVFLLFAYLNYSYSIKNVNIDFILFLLIISTFYSYIIGGMNDFAQFIGILFSLITLALFIRLKLNNKNISSLLLIFITGMSISNLIVFIYLITGDTSVYETSKDGIRLVGFFSNSNFLAASQLLILPIIFQKIIESKSVKIKLVFTMLLLLSFFILIASQSRSAIIGFVLTNLFVFTYLRYISLKRIILSSFLISIAILFFLLISQKFNLEFARLNPYISSGNVGLFDINLKSIEDDRLYLLESGIETLMHYPLGLGYTDQHVITGQLTGVYKVSHNTYLGLLVTYGIFFGLIWNGVILSLMFFSLSLLRKLNLKIDEIAVHLFVGYISFLIYNLAHDSFNWIYFWIYSLFLYMSLQNSRMIINQHGKIQLQSTSKTAVKMNSV